MRGLVARGLRRRLGGRWVVDGVDITVRPAEVTALLGPNGAGKTTLLRLLCGSLVAHGGQVMLDGRDVTALPLHRRAREGMGYLAQTPSVFTGLSAWQNVAAVLQLRSNDRDAIAARTQEALNLFGLAHLRARRAATLSGGERRRLELARLWALRPRVALLDEPFAGLDPGAATSLCDEIVKLAKQGVGVLIAEHNVRQALTIGRWACILVEGKVLTTGDMEQVVKGPAFRQAFIGAPVHG